MDNPEVQIREAFRHQEFEEVYRCANLLTGQGRWEPVFEIGQQWSEMGATRSTGHLLANLAALLHPSRWVYGLPDFQQPNSLPNHRLPNPFELYLDGLKAWWPEGFDSWVRITYQDSIDVALFRFTAGLPELPDLLKEAEARGYIEVASTGAWRVGKRCPYLMLVPRCVCEGGDDIFRKKVVMGFDKARKVTYRTVCSRCEAGIQGGMLSFR